MERTEEAVSGSSTENTTAAAVPLNLKGASYANAHQPFLSLPHPTPPLP